MKLYTLLFGTAFFAATIQAQNVGINQSAPTNSLHISPINIGDDPLKIDNMQSYVSGDTTLMIIDNTNGIVRYVNKSDLGAMIGNILFQDPSFNTTLNNFVTNNTGSDTDVDSARVVGNTLQIFENGTMVSADLTNVTGTTYTGGTGIGITGSTITNTAPDQTVSITGSGSSTVTGTYPNFTISSTDNQTLGSNATSITLTNGGSVPFNTVNANDWHTNGNAGTNAATDFLGTTDNVSVIFRSNNNERMRISNGGAVMVNTTTAAGVFTTGAAGTDNAIVGIATNGDAVTGQTNFATSFGVSARNLHATGTGIIAAGNNQTANFLTTGSGGAFTGEDGSYSKAATAAGTGVIGLGNNLTTSTTMTTGSGGAFTGNDGAYGKGVTATGTGIIGAGNNVTQYFTQASGGGGAFTGTVNGAYGKATNTSGQSRGVIGDGSEFGIVSVGNFGGTAAKYFIIDHPLDPENKILRHSCIESPEILNIYRGNVVLDANGNGVVELPNYFTAININYSYLLTPIGAPSVTYIAEEINNNGVFKISGGNPNQKISWSVYSERNDKAINHDPMTKQMEIDKVGNQIGKYLAPEAFGKSKDDSYFGIQSNTSIETESVEAITVEIKQ